MAILAILGETDTIRGGINMSGNSRVNTSGTYATSVSDTVAYRLAGNGGSVDCTLDSAVTELWFHAHIYQATTTSGTQQTLIEFMDTASGNVQLAIRSNDDSAHSAFPQIRSGGSLADLGGSYIFGNKNYKFDIHIKIHATTGIFRVYKNGSMVYEFTGDTSTVNNQIDKIVMKNYSSYTASYRYWSQVIVADESTIGWHLDTLRPTGDESLTNWTGAYSDVDESDHQSTSDTVSSDTVNAEARFSHAGINAVLPDSSHQIKAIVVASATSISSGATPTDYQHLVRVSSATYTSSNMGAVKDGSVEPRYSIWANSPATATTWTYAEVNGMSFGVKNV